MKLKKAILVSLLLVGICWATVNDNYVPQHFIGNGTTEDFAFPWPIVDTSDIVVIIRTIATEVDEVLDETTDYSVSAINNDYTSGGTVSIVPAPDSDYQISILRDTPPTQNTGLIVSGSNVLREGSLADAYDKLTLLVQELQEIVGRCLKIPKTETNTVDLVSITNRADKNITFGAEGDVTVTSVLSTGTANISAWGETLIDDGGAPEARGTLGLDTDDDVEFAAITGTTIAGTTGTFSDAISGTTGTLTDLITKGPWFDVRHPDFGAVGNGVTDDLTAIQAAVDACIASTTGGIVYFPPGKYSIDDGSITVTNGGTKSIWFVGAGMYASRIVKTTTGTDDVIIWNCTTNPSGIQNLGIIAAVGGNYSVDGISCTTMNGVFFENVWMGGFDNGFNLIGTDIHLTNCISEQNNNYGFVFDKMVRAVNCKSYLNGYGYLLKYSTAPAYPDEPAVLINCSDGESKNHAVTIDSRDNVELIGFCTESSGWNGNVGIYITGSNQIKIIGGNLRYLVDYGIQLVGTCTNVIINGVTIQEIGQTTTGIGIQMVGGSTNTLVSNCLLKNIRLSAIKTGNSSGTRITNNVIHTFGRNESAGNKFGVLMDGDAATKGSTVSNNRFVLSGGDTQTGMVWESGAQGIFFIRENEYVNGTLMDLTYAPVGTVVEQNQDDYALSTLTNDATPSVKGRLTWTTGGTTNITDFDDGYTNQIIIILCAHSLTFDTTTGQDADHNLDGSSADITVDAGDVLMWWCEDGTTWNLISNLDASVDNN